MGWQTAARYYGDTSHIETSYAHKGQKRANILNFANELVGIGGDIAGSYADKQADISSLAEYGTKISTDELKIDYNPDSDQFDITSFDKDGEVIKREQISRQSFREVKPYLQHGTLDANALFKYTSPITEEVSSNEDAFNVFTDDKGLFQGGEEDRVFGRARDYIDDKIPDTEVRDINDKEDVSVNIFEAGLIDSGYEDVVEPYVSLDEDGNYTAAINPAGMTSMLNAAKVATTPTIGAGIGTTAAATPAATAAGGTGMMAGLGAAAGTMAAVAPWVSLAFVAYDWLSGASDLAEQSKEQIAQLQEGIGVLKDKSGDVQDDFTDFKEQALDDVKLKFDSFTQEVGTKLQASDSGLKKIIKSGKGLETGEVDIQKNVIGKAIDESQRLHSSTVMNELDKLLDAESKKTRDEIEDITYTIKDMSRNIDTLEESDTFWENIF